MTTAPGAQCGTITRPCRAEPSESPPSEETFGSTDLARQVVDAAPSAERTPTGADTLDKLDRQFRARITALLPKVREKFSDLLPGTLEWDRTVSILDRIADRARQQQAPTRHGQIAQLRQLGRDYGWLLDQLPGAER